MGEKKKFYDEVWFMWVTLLFFAPVGVYLLWKKDKYNKSIRIVLSVVSILILIGMLNQPKKDNTNSTMSKAETVTERETVPLTAEEIAIIESIQADEDIKKVEAEARKVAKEAEDKVIAAEAIAMGEYKSWIDSQFSAWDGSCKPLVALVKKNMNDDGSFEHVETTYKDSGQGIGFTVYMTYRGTNKFGGVVKNSVIAFCNYQTKMIQITSSN